MRCQLIQTVCTRRTRGTVLTTVQAEALKQGMWSAIGKMQDRLTASCGGLALANGMIGGPLDPHAPADPYNLVRPPQHAQAATRAPPCSLLKLEQRVATQYNLVRYDLARAIVEHAPLNFGWMAQVTGPGHDAVRACACDLGCGARDRVCGRGKERGQGGR